jgi:PKD repeat protein
MTTIKLSGKWRQRPLLFRFLATLYLLTMFSNSSVFSQTLDCGPINCTSNDVRVVSAYISGPLNAPIDCGSTNPFDQAELHLIVSSNTQRIGASIVGKLNILGPNGTSVDLAHCFSGITLNNGSNNNLVYQLGSTLSTLACPQSFTLSDLFISWGTGNTNFCTSEDAKCPATPAKCRFKAGETIPVTVKLDVDFTFVPGVCNLDGNSLAVDFTPVITATGLISPYTYTWDFGDNTATNTGTVTDLSLITGVSHTYASAATYTVTLTITDSHDPVNTKTGSNALMLASCCNLTAPSLSAGPFCSVDGKTIGDLPQTDGNGGTYHWYSAADPNNSFELDPLTVIPVGTNTYYVSVASGNCESARTAVNVTVNQTPTSPIVTGPLCAGATTISGTSTESDGASIIIYAGASQIGTAVVANGVWSSTVSALSAGDVITAVTTSASNCVSAASTAVTVSDNAAAPTVNPVCEGATTVSGTNESGASVQVFINTISVGTASVSGTTWTKTVSALSAGNTITAVSAVTGKCSSGNSAPLTVNPLPPCTITSTGSPRTAPLGSSTVFSGPTGINYSYTWSISNNTSSASFVGSHGTGDATVTVTTSTIGSYTVNLSVTNTVTGCSSASNCSYIITVTPTGPFYTVTQGFYGNVGGKVCMAGKSYIAGSTTTVAGLIETSISNMLNQKLILGSSTKSFTMGNSVVEANNLIKYMPGNQTPAKLSGIYNITTSLPPLSKNKIANVFLTESITLALNVSIPNNSLGAFVLKTGYLTTQKTDPSSCPSTKVLACTVSSSSISSVKITTNAGLINWINSGTKTVQNLLDLASASLGGASLPSGVTLSDINNAIDVINNAFDGGKFFLGYYATSKSCSSTYREGVMTSNQTNPVSLITEPAKLSVTAYPNPFSNEVEFLIESPVAGMATLNVYNIVGQKLHTVYQGYLYAGAKQLIDYKVPSSYKGALIYTLKIGNQEINGKLVQMK